MNKQDLINELEKLLEGKPWGLKDRVEALLHKLKTTQISKQRTIPQNNSIHLWLKLVADELNNQGQTIQNVVAKIRKAEIRPTMLALKEVAWRPYQMVAVHKESTTQLNKHEVDIIYEGLNKFFSQEFGIGIPFPSQEVNATNYYSQAEKLCK